MILVFIPIPLEGDIVLEHLIYKKIRPIIKSNICQDILIGQE